MTRVKIDLLDEKNINSCEECPLGARFDDITITCFEGAYDGLGFGIDKSDWKPPPCGGMTFRDAMRQRKALGEEALFGQVHLIPQRDNNSKSSKNKGEKIVHDEKKI